MSASRSATRALRTAILGPVRARTVPGLGRLACVRPISYTPVRRASEVPKDPLADPQIQAFYEKLRNHQGAVDAMMHMRKLMQDKGFDTTKPPSTMQMMKLGMDSQLREAGMNLMKELKAAGIEMTPDSLKDLFGKMKQ